MILLIFVIFYDCWEAETHHLNNKRNHFESNKPEES
jgi:hypothetical protein